MLLAPSPGGHKCHPRDSRVDPAQLLPKGPPEQGFSRQGHRGSLCPKYHHPVPDAQRILKMMPPKQAEKAMRG